MKKPLVASVLAFGLALSAHANDIVDNAKVTPTDIVADNGVIHVIDSVVVPK